MFLVEKYVYFYKVNRRNGLIGPETIGIDTKLNFLSQLLRQVQGIMTRLIMLRSPLLFYSETIK